MASWHRESSDSVLPVPAVSRADALDSVTLPEKSARDWEIALLLFVASCAYLLIFRRFSNLNPDEGITLQGAQLILHGQVMYRDFFYFVTPGSEYWMALLFKVFGSSILVARTALVIYGGLFSIFTYLLARRVSSRVHSIFAALPAVLIALPLPFDALHNWDSTLWALLALYCAVRFLERPAWGWAFGMGSLTAITCLFEQSKGAGLALGLVAGFVALAWADRSGFRIETGSLVAMSVGCAWPFLLTVAYFAAHHALAPMISDLLWSFRYLSSGESLPYGHVILLSSVLDSALGWRYFVLFLLSPRLIVSALPIFALPVAVYSARRLRGRRQDRAPSRYYLLVSAVLAGLLLSTLGTGRPDADHILFQAPLFCLVLAWMAEAGRSRFLRTAKAIGGAYVMASFAGLALALISMSLAAGHRLETRRGVLLGSAASQAALNYTQNHVAAGERILVYPYQPLLYYLTGTFSVSRYEYMQRGLDDPSQFEEMRREVAASRPRVVLFEPMFSDAVAEFFPGTRLAVVAAKDPVADYISTHYHPCRDLPRAHVGSYLVFMARNDLSCSEESLARRRTGD